MLNLKKPTTTKQKQKTKRASSGSQDEDILQYIGVWCSNRKNIFSTDPADTNIYLYFRQGLS